MTSSQQGQMVGAWILFCQSCSRSQICLWSQIPRGVLPGQYARQHKWVKTQKGLWGWQCPQCSKSQKKDERKQQSSLFPETEKEG